MIETFEKIRKIQITTTQLAEDLLAGAYHSAFKGQGMEFEEVREYQAGDDLRAVDWNVTARMNHPYVKVFREERELTVMLMVDISASTRFMLKRELMAEIGAVIAFSAIKNSDKVGLILFSDEVELYLPQKKGSRHVLHLIRELLTFEPNHRGTNLKEALSALGKVHCRRAICFLISDFICDLPEHELSLATKHHDLIFVNVRDKNETSLPDVGLITVTDLETGESGVIDSSLPRENDERVQQLAKKIGAGLIEIQTDEPYIDPIRKFFKLRRIRH